MIVDSDLYASSPYALHFIREETGGPLPPLLFEEDARSMSQDVREHAGDNAGPMDRFVCILADRRLQPGPTRFGTYVKDDRVGDQQRSVCFSGLPLGLLDRLLSRRSHWGLGFAKSSLEPYRGAPVWYVRDGGPQQQALGALIAREAAWEPFDPGSPLWDLTPFIDKAGDPHTGKFQWEREWRVPGPNGFAFDPPEVEFLFAPAHEHDAVRDFLQGTARDGTLPAYDCPLFDPTWDAKCVHKLISEHHRRRPVRSVGARPPA